MLHARMLTCSFVLAAGVLASAFAMQTDEKNRQILGMLSSLAKQDKKKKWDSVFISSKSMPCTLFEKSKFIFSSAFPRNLEAST